MFGRFVAVYHGHSHIHPNEVRHEVRLKRFPDSDWSVYHQQLGYDSGVAWIRGQDG